ncbi:Inner membrane protein ybjJ [Cedecea lapagei]|uniref:Inner membrane protein ybjJ n=1 Tax=Cedecea lapagei TaxID=158823 RepID=A0A447V7E1_9ENTR|nr:MFS transporter [Cedecea lapagei]VEC01209.1 Inner membrane protein ybjJ [Cedecea lapagei]
MTINSTSSLAGVQSREQHATRAIFFMAGLAMSSWAPLIPFAKARLDINDGALGLLLFCIAAGSMLIMPFTGRLLQKFGCRRLILLSASGLAVDLPLLMLFDQRSAMALALLLFGTFNGMLDVAMNAHAVVVEQESEQAKMSGFHGFYSIGSIAGAGSVSVFLWLGATPLLSVCAIAVFLALLLSASSRHILPKQSGATDGKGETLRVLSHPPVLVIAVMCFFVFMLEGAMLDWSAVFMTSERGMSASLAGFGYTLYSLTVALGRLSGDRLVSALGGKLVLLFGCAVACVGIVLLVFTEWGALPGFILVGAGLANIIPVLFTSAGNQPGVSADFAIPAVTLFGYSGLLAGPALIGFIAHHIGLTLTFSGALLLLLFVASGSPFISRQR